MELAAILPLAGYRARGPKPAEREVPSKVYFDLATWHLVNTVYTPARVMELLPRMRSFYADATLHARLLAIVEHRLGHARLGAAEAAKIAVADAGSTGQVDIPLDAVEDGLAGHLTEPDGVAPEQVDVVYLTGGSVARRVAAAHS